VTAADPREERPLSGGLADRIRAAAQPGQIVQMDRLAAEVEEVVKAALGFIDEIAEVTHERDQLRAAKLVTDEQLRKQAELIDMAGKLADEWADQSTDYDEDTEQQIADGRTLRGLLRGDR
jgi:hypothetical protein